jgi:hypothetical protein
MKANRDRPYGHDRRYVDADVRTGARRRALREPGDEHGGPESE